MIMTRLGFWAALVLAFYPSTDVRAQADVPEPAGFCDPYGEPDVSLQDRGTAIRYCGKITGAGFDEVRRLFVPDVRRLIISSAGGSYDAPLDLAFLVERHSLELVVDGICFSGCASAVFVAARERTLTETAVLGFHNTSSSAFYIVHFLFPEQRDNFGRLFQRFTGERSLYARQGVDPNILVHGQVSIDPICADLAVPDPSNGEPTINIVSQADLWIPTEREARRAGLTWKGSLPPYHSGSL